MNKINYQLELDREIDEIKKQGRVPSLLLHSCCGPCSSYVLEYLTKYFDVTPAQRTAQNNISPARRAQCKNARM